jgi:hypothetical protein
MTKHAGGAVMVWGAEPPAFSIGWMEPLGSWDSGFTVIFQDGPDPRRSSSRTRTPPTIRASGRSISACLLGEHPEIGRGLDIAREHRVADLDDDGEWVVGDVEPARGVNGSPGPVFRNDP